MWIHSSALQYEDLVKCAERAGVTLSRPIEQFGSRKRARRFGVYMVDDQGRRTTNRDKRRLLAEVWSADPDACITARSWVAE
jgi:hypothetical protein